MSNFLTRNGPWAQLVDRGEISLEVLQPGHPIVLARDPETNLPDLTITAFSVPHRDEFSDNVGYRVEGPTKSVLYIPDIDKWERFETPIEELIAGVDVALLDGTFFSDGEIPGRSMSDIPHPFSEEGLARLSDLPPEQRAKVLFTHLNHTNPAADPHSEAAKRVRAAGMAVAREGLVIRL